MRFLSIAALMLSLMLPAAFVPSHAHALTFDKFQVTPSVGFTSVYDDNIFATDSNRVDDFYFLVSPALLLKYGRTENKLELEYGADIYRYVDTGDFNDAEDHRLRAAADLNFSKLSIKLNDLGMRGHESRSEENTVLTPENELSRYWSNDLNAELSYAISETFKAALAYEFYLIGYNLDTNKFRDLYKHKADATLYYGLSPKTSALLQGTYARADHYNRNSSFSSQLDSNEYWAMGGLTWDITEKSTGTIKGGYEWKVFDKPGNRNFSSPIYIISLDHKFTSKTSIRVSGLRQAQETDDQDVSYYTKTNGSLEMRFNPISKLEIKPHGSISYNRYSGLSSISGQIARRVDTVADGGIDLIYSMNKWFTISAGYKHAKRSSTFTIYDYTDNTGMIKLEASI